MKTLRDFCFWCYHLLFFYIVSICTLKSECLNIPDLSFLGFHSLTLFRMGESSNVFADMFILKKSLKTQEKLKELEIMNQNTIFICISWYSKICWFLLKNADVSRNQGVRHAIHIIFGFSLRYNCVKLHHCRIYVTDFREGGFLAPYTREQSRKSPSWIGLTEPRWDKARVSSAAIGGMDTEVDTLLPDVR